jgi:CDP-glycerol glycerophosphotransferase
MFDFAVTGKPIVHFTYDLAYYRDELRGFYFDLAEVAPGPLLTTSDEVVAAIGALSDAGPEPTPRYRTFQETFCALEDGHATDRVLDLFFPRTRPDGGTPTPRTTPTEPRR